MAWSIYRIVHIESGQAYIGCSNNPERRWLKDHASAVRCGHPHPLYQAIREHGVDAFKFEIIQGGLGFYDALDFERIYMAKHRFHGQGIYNLTDKWPPTLAPRIGRTRAPLIYELAEKYMNPPEAI